jgi:hypothetical protein
MIMGIVMETDLKIWTPVTVLLTSSMCIKTVVIKFLAIQLLAPLITGHQFTFNLEKEM